MYLYSDGKYVAIKNIDEEEVRISSGRCSYNEATEEYETVGICSDLESELEKVKEENNKKIEEIRNEYEERISNLTNDYEEQKKTIENTYKDQIEELNRRIEELEANKEADIAQIRAEYEDRIKTQKEAYEAQINELNRQLNIFKTGGTASASDIASGKTAYVNGELITGTLENNTDILYYKVYDGGATTTARIPELSVTINNIAIGDKLTILVYTTVSHSSNELTYTSTFTYSGLSYTSDMQSSPAQQTDTNGMINMKRYYMSATSDTAKVNVN